ARVPLGTAPAWSPRALRDLRPDRSRRQHARRRSRGRSRVRLLRRGDLRQRASDGRAARRGTRRARAPHPPALATLAWLVDDADEAAVAARPERDLAAAHREDRVVLAETSTGAGPEARAALADKDHPGRNVLAVEHLHAEHLRVRVAAVPRRAKSLLMCH